MDGLKMKAKVRASSVVVDAERWEPGVDLEGIEYSGDLTGETVPYLPTLQGPVPLREGCWVVTTPYGARMVFGHDDFTALFESSEGRVTLELNGYQAANLRAALGAVLADDGPLSCLNTGDWCGELSNMLEDAEIDVTPNETSEEILETARSWKR